MRRQFARRLVTVAGAAIGIAAVLSLVLVVRSNRCSDEVRGRSIDQWTDDLQSLEYETSKEAELLFRSRLRHPNDDCRAQAAGRLAVAQYVDQNTVDELTSCLDDRTEKVRGCAYQSLDWLIRMRFGKLRFRDCRDRFCDVVANSQSRSSRPLVNQLFCELLRLDRQLVPDLFFWCLFSSDQAIRRKNSILIQVWIELGRPIPELLLPRIIGGGDDFIS